MTPLNKEDVTRIYKGMMITATTLKTLSLMSSYLAASVTSTTFVMFDWTQGAKGGFFAYNGVLGAIFGIFVLVTTYTYLVDLAKSTTELIPTTPSERARYARMMGK